MDKVWDYKSDKDDNLAKLVSKDNDIVFTKPEMAKKLISLIPYAEEDTWIEPCRGKGAFYNLMPLNSQWCEINEGRNYFNYDFGKVDITVSNPPFVPRKLFIRFHERAMDTTRKQIWWLISMVSFGAFTPKRLNSWANQGWFMSKIHLCQDKRWYGRYGFICFTRTPSDWLSWDEQVF